MQIRTLDAGRAEEFARFHAVMTAAERFERPWATVPSVEESWIEFTDDDPAERHLGFVAVDGGEIVGAGAAYLPLADNLHCAWVMPWVEPAHRGRGIGSAVLDHLVEVCRAERRRDLITETAYPLDRQHDHPHRRFAEEHGFALANTEICRTLGLPVDEGLLERLAEQSADHHRGYRIETFVDPVPEDLLPSLCDCMNELAVDAPTGRLSFEREALTPVILRHREDTARRQGRTVLTTAALTGDREVVAYTTLVIPSGDLPHVYQWGTLVRAQHRGHRLGMAVKARGLLELQRRVGPERTRVQTSNAEQNQHMVAINERLGFRILEARPSFLRRSAS
jgi:GNAT superfamily N-acetyltransferase